MNRESTDYQEKRERNNVAVKKSREQTREKTKQTLERVAHLRSENEQLEQQVKLLSKELDVLKDLFKVSHPQDIASTPEAVKVFEAAIQTENYDTPVSLPTVTSSAVEFHDETVAVKVNQSALQKDHEYFVKIEK